MPGKKIKAYQLVKLFNLLSFSAKMKKRGKQMQLKSEKHVANKYK